MPRSTGHILQALLVNRRTKDSDLIVIFGENAAATVGLLFALFALVASYVTGDSRWDAGGSLAIGVVLVGVAIFLAIEVKSLLIGESADPEIEAATREIILAQAGVEKLLQIISVQQGPGEVLVALKVGFAESLSGKEVCEAINTLASTLRKARPEVRWIFVEPDVPRALAVAASA